MVRELLGASKHHWFPRFSGEFRTEIGCTLSPSIYRFGRPIPIVRLNISFFEHWGHRKHNISCFLCWDGGFSESCLSSFFRGPQESLAYSRRRKFLCTQFKVGPKTDQNHQNQRVLVQIRPSWGVLGCFLMNFVRRSTKTGLF